jgi:hypothetical protein
VQPAERALALVGQLPLTGIWRWDLARGRDLETWPGDETWGPGPGGLIGDLGDLIGELSSSYSGRIGV